MKTVIRAILTAIYTVCWCGLFPVMLTVKTIIATCVWCSSYETRTFWDILKDKMSDKWWDSPNELWG